MNIKDRIDELEKQIDEFELNPEDYQDMLDDFLDENGEVEIAGMVYRPSHVLKEVDPVAYREMLLNFVDDQDPSGDPEYKDLIEELESLKSEI